MTEDRGQQRSPYEAPRNTGTGYAKICKKQGGWVLLFNHAETQGVRERFHAERGNEVTFLCCLYVP